VSAKASGAPTPSAAPGTAQPGGGSPNNGEAAADCGVYTEPVSREQYVQDIREAGGHLYDWNVAHGFNNNATRSEIMDQWEMLHTNATGGVSSDADMVAAAPANGPKDYTEFYCQLAKNGGLWDAGMSTDYTPEPAVNLDTGLTICEDLMRGLTIDTSPKQHAFYQKTHEMLCPQINNPNVSEGGQH
jgi:hypothetical protein